jgi:YgiT-type zinc finger domain-containing protein
MIPDRCSFCKGKLREGKAEFLAHAAGGVIVIKDVPAYVCEQCGEAYYTATISQKIDEVMQAAHQKKLCMRPLPAGEVSLNG